MTLTAAASRGAARWSIRVWRRAPGRYDTARAVESGNLQTGLGAYLAMLWAMGLESEIRSFADPERDDEGKQLESSRLPKRVRHRKATVDGDF